MPQRWAIRFALEGDLRFCSHHDMMRAVERAARRSGAAIRYSQGFNPHPRLSLVCPRPVGVATRDDVLMLVLDEPTDAADLLARLNRQAPEGMEFLAAEEMESSSAPLPLRQHMELPIAQQDRAGLGGRIEELLAQPQWPFVRKLPGKSGRPPRSRKLDLRPLVDQLALEGDTLRFVLVRQKDLWARPGEVLALLGLDERADLARLIRRQVEYEM